MKRALTVEIGATFGRLTVVRCLGMVEKYGMRRLLYELRCSCGGMTTQGAAPLLRGSIVSCGCERRKTFAIQVSRAARVRRFQDPVLQNLPKRPPKR